ncbi:MAG TPA: antiterminator LoaP [Treponemataceae bacterium]|nr:antiterminator LoaP [Treponemataceae bacterium]
MNYYALQVKTGAEDSYIKRMASMPLGDDEGSLRLIFPRRRLMVRRKGKNVSELAPIFPGYIFLETEELSQDLYWILRTTDGFYRFLPDNVRPLPIGGRDLATLKHFTALGDIADRSKVRFDENDRIQVAEGPLKGLEGRIVKVDKRKGRAKVKLDMYDESFLIDLSFELLSQ